MQQFAHRAYVQPHRPARRDFITQISTPPTDHLLAVRVWTIQNHLPQFSHLFVTQCRRTARNITRMQPIDTLRVVAVHPIAQCLSIHAVVSRRLRPAITIQHRRDRQQAAYHRPIALMRCQLA